MARHLAPSQEKKNTKPERRLEALPRVLDLHIGRGRKSYERDFSLRTLLPVLAAALLFLTGFLLRSPQWVRVLLLGASALASAFELLRRCLRRILSRTLPDEELLILLGVVLAFCLGEFAAGAFALLMWRAAELVQAYALTRAEGGVELLRGVMPEKAVVERGGEPFETVPEAVEPGELLLVAPEERIALDGVVEGGISSIDTSALSGDGVPVNVSHGSQVLSGCLNLSGELRVRVSRSFEESAAAVRLRTFEEANAMDSLLEKRLRRYAAFFVPGMAILALLLGVGVPIFSGNWAAGLRRALIFLLLSSPCALLISVPLCFRGALTCAERKGIKICGRGCVERMARVRTMVFGKTGVITDGRFRVTDVYPDGVSEEELLKIAAAAESRSRSPLAEALRRAAGWTEEMGEGVMEVEEIPGRGISAFIEGRHVYVGSAALLEDHGILYWTPGRAGTAVHVAVENLYWGHILLSDRVRDGAFDALEDLRAQGVNQMVMMTGDVLSVTRSVASALNFDMVKAELSPESKLSALRYLKSGLGDRACLAYVGDGIHDEALFDQADLGIALDSLRNSGGRERSDAAIMSGEITRLPQLMRIASVALRAVWQNILLVCGVKLLLMILALCGVLPIAIASAADALASVLAALNALRSFTTE